MGQLRVRKMSGLQMSIEGGLTTVNVGSGGQNHGLFEDFHFTNASTDWTFTNNGNGTVAILNFDGS
jgi:hypothetical protein